MIRCETSMIAEHQANNYTFIHFSMQHRVNVRVILKENNYTFLLCVSRVMLSFICDIKF